MPAPASRPRRRGLIKWLAFAAGLILGGLPCAEARAGADLSKSLAVSVTETSPFTKGMREFDFTAGFLYSPLFSCGGKRPVFSYAQQDISLGWMLSSPGEPGWLRGNWEFLVNVFGAEVINGPGSYMAGGRLLLRYNFVQPNSRWVPFFQLGGGGLGNDVYRDRNQRVVGGGFEFTLVAEAGVRFFIRPNWALVLSADFEHISNANTASRNLGANAGGAMFGVATFF